MLRYQLLYFKWIGKFSNVFFIWWNLVIFSFHMYFVILFNVINLKKKCKLNFCVPRPINGLSLGQIKAIIIIICVPRILDEHVLGMTVHRPFYTVDIKGILRRHFVVDPSSHWRLYECKNVLSKAHSVSQKAAKSTSFFL